MNKELKKAIFYHENKKLKEATIRYEKLLKNQSSLKRSDLSILYVNYANILFLDYDFKKVFLL